MNIVARPKIIKVAVISAYRGSTEEETSTNVLRTLNLGRNLLSLGVMPLIPHLYFTAMLNDSVPEEREYGIRLGKEWLEEADLFLVDSVDGAISEGMKHDIEVAQALVNPARIFNSYEDLVNFILRRNSTDDTEQVREQETTSTANQ